MEDKEAQAPLLDTAHFRTMHDALGEDFASLIADFFADCPRFSTGLTTLAGAGDADGFRELSHELKGASALLGFSGISACAAQWETMSKDGKLPGIASIRERLPGLVEDTRKLVGGMA